MSGAAACRGGTFRSLNVHNFRLWFFGSLVSSLGLWMQSTALGWVVLTELTRNDVGAMGLATALQLFPIVVLVPVTGRFVDRFDRRRMLLVCEAALGVVALAIGALLLAGGMTLTLMLVMAGVSGVILAFESPLRSAFVGDVVDGALAMNAVSLTSVQNNLARLVGPSLAGLLLAMVDSGWVFVLNGVTSVALVVSLGAMRIDELVPRVRDVTSGSMRAAVAHVRGRGDLVVLFAVVFLVSASAINFPVFGAAMAVAFGEGPGGFGLLASCYAVGSFTGSIVVARRLDAPMRRIVLSTAAAAITLLVSAVMPGFWAYAGVSVVCGYAIFTVMATANAYMQVETDRDVRGRVMVVYIACLQGGTPFGAPVLGWVAVAWGPRATVAIAGAVSMVAALVGLAWLAKSGRTAVVSGRPVSEEKTVAPAPAPAPVRG